MQQKIIQQSPGGNQQIIQQQVIFTKIENGSHLKTNDSQRWWFFLYVFDQVPFQQESDQVMGQQHNQAILITSNQVPNQPPSQTPPMQQMGQPVC